MVLRVQISCIPGCSELGDDGNVRSKVLPGTKLFFCISVGGGGDQWLNETDDLENSLCVRTKGRILWTRCGVSVRYATDG